MGHGGKRAGSGLKKGQKLGQRASTLRRLLTKEQGRDALRALVLERLRPLVEAQLANALGVRHTFLRDESGRFVQLTDPRQIEVALNSGDEGKYYWTFTKDPSIQAFADLMNRALDKPADQAAPAPQPPQQINVSVKVASLASALGPQQLQVIREHVSLTTGTGRTPQQSVDSRGNRPGDPVSTGA